MLKEQSIQFCHRTELAHLCDEVWMASKSVHNFNILIDVVCLFHSVRKANRKYLKNYNEIYIKSDLDQLIKRKKKFFYKKKVKNVWGKDLIPELPKYPDVIVKNNFTKTPNQIAKNIFSKLKK